MQPLVVLAPCDGEPVMPPLEPLDPPEGDIVPYPNDILTLGGNRWLTISGRIIPEPFGDPADLKPNTLAFWEAAALGGTGKPLSELIVPVKRVVPGA